MSPDPCKVLLSSSCGPLFLLAFPWGRSDVRGVFCEFCLPMCTLKRHSCLQAWREGGGRPGAPSFSWSLCHAASAPPAPGGITPCPGEVSNLEMSFLNFQGIDKSLLCPWGTLAPDRRFPHAFFFPEHCWQWSNRAEHEDLSTLQGNGEVLIMLIMEIRDNLVLCTVPRRGELGHPILVSAQCSAPWLCPVAVPWHCAPSSGAEGSSRSWLGSAASRSAQAGARAGVAAFTWCQL